MNNEKKDRYSDSGLAAVEEALLHGGKVYDSTADFDAALDHVAGLLEDSITLFDRGSFATSAFLAITAIEETGKAHVAIYRKDSAVGGPKGRDPLRDHRAKHRMAILPTVFMSARLLDALGAERCRQLQDEAQTSGFTAIREAALYCARDGSRFVTPGAAVSPSQAWELLLLAIEAADDALVGYTNHSTEVGKHFDDLFRRVTAQCLPAR